MNRKGFTLVELLATIFILTVVMGIATVSVTSYIKNSQKKGEEIFVDKLSTAIESYLNLEGSKLGVDKGPYSFKKCLTSKCQDNDHKSSYQATAYLLERIHLHHLVDANLLEESDIQNPSTRKKCLEDGRNPEIVIYKDSDYVYYYYVDLSGENTSCEISKENDLISTLPSTLVSSLVVNGVDLPEKLVGEGE